MQKCMQSLYSPVQGQSITIFILTLLFLCGFITFTVINVQGGKHPHALEHLGAASSSHNNYFHTRMQW